MFFKVKYTPTLGPCSSTIYQRNVKTDFKEDKHRNIHIFISSGHALETAWVPLNRRMDKQMVIFM